VNERHHQQRCAYRAGLSFRTRKKNSSQKTQANLKLKLKFPKKLKKIFGKFYLPEIFFSSVAGIISK